MQKALEKINKKDIKSMFFQLETGRNASGVKTETF